MFFFDRPSQKHLEAALNDLKVAIDDVAGCISEAEGQMFNLLGQSTPQTTTPKYGSAAGGSGKRPTPIASCEGKATPVSTNPLVNRARLLEKYGTPPALTPYGGNPTPRVMQKFKPPAKIIKTPADKTN